MKAIITKRLAMTNTKPTRIKATDGDGNSVTISYPLESKNDEAAHRLAARVLCDKMKWTGKLVAGGFCHGYVFVFDTKSKSNI